jgi:hypothetical protein
LFHRLAVGYVKTDWQQSSVFAFEMLQRIFKMFFAAVTESHFHSSGRQYPEYSLSNSTGAPGNEGDFAVYVFHSVFSLFCDWSVSVANRTSTFMLSGAIR